MVRTILFLRCPHLYNGVHSLSLSTASDLRAFASSAVSAGGGLFDAPLDQYRCDAASPLVDMIDRRW